MVKYCQECGNASYDSAPVCGNCGAKFPPKSEANSQPPLIKKVKSPQVVEVKEFKKITSPSDENIAKSIENLRNNLSKNFNDISGEIKVEDKPIVKKEPSSFTSGSIIGFKEKSTATKDPARKFKSKVSTDEIFKEAVKEKTTKKPSAPKKETIKKDIINKDILKKIETPNINSSEFKFNLTKKNIGILAIVIIILIAIVGASVVTMNNTTNNEPLYYTDGTISFYYPGNWSMYNNSNDGAGGEIAFKTQDKVLIGYTTITSDDISLLDVTHQINATAESLGGKVVKAYDTTIDGIQATDITISSSEHGYSRYISIIHHGVYYSFVINTGKTDNPSDMSVLNSTDIQNMISSIKFTDLLNETSNNSTN